jgi:hypothetical protein
VTAILRRHQSLGTRPIEFHVRRHPAKDSGCRTDGPDYLAAFAGQYDHCILMFDYEGCGEESLNPGDLRAGLLDQLRRRGWADRADVIIIVPELDIWVWSDSPHVEEVLGWKGRTPSLKSWLIAKGLVVEGQVKPPRPKEALEAVLREVRKPRSSAVYEELARLVSFSRCTDAAFEQLRSALRRWFGTPLASSQ